MNLLINYLLLKNDYFEPCSPDDESLSWISVESPTEEEIERLVNQYHLPTDYLTGVLDDEENARVEGFRHEKLQTPTLLLFRYPKASISPSGYLQVETVPIALIATVDNKLITVSNGPNDIVHGIQKEAFTHQGLSIEKALILALSWKMALSFNKNLQALIQQTNKLEGELQVATENSQLYQIMDIQKSLVYFEAALTDNLKVLKRLYSAEIFNHPEKHLPFLRDILIELEQGLNTTKIQLKLVDNISNTFSAIVSNNLNNVMKILTSLTIVLTIPTIIGGIYGMNVKLPFAEHEYSFWIIFAITTLICVISIRILKKKNLL
ncbi:magnesium transporter CorA family protein [Enterococcus faecalis]|uniref:magnesium transporter CorA family protein n=1 Tax=Enterococcus faecalis TaxID=1351 RepID=UPI000DE80559|nr:magnesium transporter CorA family protein [Enterococcus faecalis]EGO7777233.1 magnesium transporter CorA family protein [Enterococcus faecalis]EGO7815774.1 magnesium transporter CorA family protein [Enterococcus faecalis]EGO7988084.1 magnesium transporter CorA family protein [Enterococcus faecalis]EGO8277442.1 magnesium transporter CorA family protein [Enterococcus faecalis]EGO8397216.1 magnesium transporter CorA family protein [Enterococcus faecalis]